MDSLASNTYRIAAENNFHKFKRTAFQDWLGSILLKRFPDDYLRIRLSQGDGGLDGYRLSSQAVFQVFAPREYSSAEIIKKINDDFQHAKETLAGKGLEMKEWVFVHNDPDYLTHDVVTELAKLQDDNPNVKIRRWEFTAIWNQIKQLSEDELIELFGAAPTLAMLEQLCYKDIIPVVEYLATVKAPPLPPTDPPALNKLEFNALSSDHMAIVISGRVKQGLVDAYLKGMPNADKPEAIAQAFRERYASLRAAGLAVDSIFNELWLFAGGQVFASEPIKMAAMIAVLAYYFDSCDIFENTPEAA